MPLALMKSAGQFPITLPGYCALTTPRGVPVAAAKIIITAIALATFMERFSCAPKPHAGLYTSCLDMTAQTILGPAALRGAPVSAGVLQVSACICRPVNSRKYAINSADLRTGASASPAISPRSMSQYSCVQNF